MGACKTHPDAAAGARKCRYDVDGDKFFDAWVKDGGAPPIHYRNDLTNKRIKIKF